MKVQRSIDIKASADSIWEVIGTGFPDAHKWASAIDHSESRVGTGNLTGVPHTGRSCETSIGSVRENILTYDEDAHRISYEAFSDSMPGFVKRLVADWRFSKGSSGSTLVHMTLTVEVAVPFNVLMGPLMKLQMGGILSATMKDLKHFVETGNPSPAKLKSKAKYQKKAGRAAAA